MKVSKEEMEAARDAVIAHAITYGRTHVDALLVFEELVRQLKQHDPNKPDVKALH